MAISWSTLTNWLFPGQREDPRDALDFYGLKVRDHLWDADDPSILGGAEFDPSLQARAGTIVYERMRRSDTTIAGLLRIMKGPSLSCTWTVDCEDEEIKDFVADNLGIDEGCDACVDFPKFLREALTFMEFGFAAFEKVMEYRDGRDRLVDLAYRPQVSIEKFHVDGRGRLEAIEQIVKLDPDKKTVRLPADRVLYVGQVVGSQYWGESLLRSSYKPFYIKERLLLIDAVAHQRFGLGIPEAKFKPGTSRDARAAMEKILGSLTSQRKSYLMYPEDQFEVSYLTLRQAERVSPLDSIRYLDVEMAKSLGALMFNLGTSQSGSRAVAGTFSNLFFNALSSVLDMLTSAVNYQVVRPLVTANFGSGAPYTALQWSNLDTSHLEPLARALSNLTTAGVIRPDGVLEDVVRGEFRLPSYDETTAFGMPADPGEDD